jgi:hypothetical protein
MPRKKKVLEAPPAGLFPGEDPQEALVDLLEDLVARETLKQIIHFGALVALQQRDLTKGQDRVTVLVNRIFTPERLEELLRS